MADINQIKLPNGSTYNIKDTVSGYTANNGTVTSVATGTGLTGGTITTSGTISIANHSADYISGGYLNIHPENNPTLIPFVNNDIAYLLKRGGSVIVKYDGTTQTVDLSNCFDASPSYWAINQSITTITIELTLHRVFSWSNTIYIDFGNDGWRAKGVKIEVMNTNYPQDVWSQKYNNTNNSLGHCYVSMSHKPVGADNAGAGFNKIRFTLNPNQSAFRIAQIGVYNYGSSGLRETFLPKDGGSLIGSLTPQTNNTYNLGSSNYKWANGYFTNINGVSVGSSPKFTDTTYESKAAASGGTAVSLCTTGEKYTWNNKSNLALGTTSTTALKGDTKYAGSSSAGGSATSAVKLDTATAGSATQPCYFTGGKPSACTYSLNKTVPADAQFTDTTYESKTAASGGTALSLVTTGEKYTWNAKSNTDNKVAQTATSDNANYEVLFSATANNTTKTEGARKNSNLTFNPSTGKLSTTWIALDNGTEQIDAQPTGLEIRRKLSGSDIYVLQASIGTSSDYGGRIVIGTPTSQGGGVDINGQNNYGNIKLKNSSAKEVVNIRGSSCGIIDITDSSETTTIKLNGSDGNITCSTVNSHTVPSVKFGYTRHTFTSSTTLSYTGKSVTCPTGKRMIVRAYFRYVNNGPQQVLASLQSTTYGNYYSEVLDHKNGQIGGCLNFMLNSGETAYYWAKYAGAGTNYIDESTITFTES